MAPADKARLGTITVTELDDTQDLNGVTATGLYTEDSGAVRPGLNYPTETGIIAGAMLVVASARRVFQLYQVYDGRVFARASFSGAWRDWSLLTNG